MNEVIKKYRAETTQKLIQALKDRTAPWVKPWSGGGAPQNAITGRKYTGMNTVILSVGGGEYDNGFDPRWCTFKQAAKKGWKIKKGAKGVQISYWDTVIKEVDLDKEPDIETEEAVSKYFMQKVYTVFHSSQIEGIPEYAPKILNSEQRIAKAEELIKNSGADIRHGGFESFYDRSGDYIQVPEIQYFKTLEDYYATVLHELAHWSGAPERLNRKKGKIIGGAYDEKYCREELIAEITSLFLSAETGIAMTDEHFKNHAAYISEWIKLLSDDDNAIFKAAADASRAADFILKAGQAKVQEEAA